MMDSALESNQKASHSISFPNNSGSINCEMKIADEDAPLTSSSNIINTHILIRAHQRQDSQLIECFLYLDLSKKCHFDKIAYSYCSSQLELPIEALKR